MKQLKRFVALALSGAMLLPTVALAAGNEDGGSEIVYSDTTVTCDGITFQREQEGVYAGLPLFDADPEHLDTYLDVYMDYIGLDGMVRIALEKRNDYTLTNTYTFSSDYGDANLAGKTITWENDNAGKVIPGSPQFSSPEAVQGYSTNFPAQIGVGQTWNKNLVAQEGNVVGTEKLYGSGSLSKEGSYLSDANQMVSTALTDVRANPLSGRIDEGYAEDPYLAAVMSDTMAAGVTGHDQEESDNGFWQMAFVDTKHFSNYLAQWQRNYGSFFNSARGLLEYVTRSTYKGFSNDNFGCFMTSYGTTNYVPNGMSPLINYVKQMSSYPISTINDNGAETALHYVTGTEQIKLQVNGAYLKVDSKGNLGTQMDGDVAIFNLYAWGQDDSISLQETTTGKWLTYTTGDDTTLEGVSLEEDAMHLGAGKAEDGEVVTSVMPGNMRREYVDDTNASFRLLANTFTGGFFNDFEDSYYTEAVYLCVDEDGELSYKDPAGSADNIESVRTPDTVFTAEVVNTVAQDVYTDGDAAIVVIGVSPTFSAGEGTDRVDLDLGAEQYALCDAVAEKYPGKTVVVVKVSSPVNLQPLEDNENIGAILYQPYAGEYEGLALGRLLFGDVEPTGRLVNTWYNTTDVLPAIDQSVIHNGWAKEGITLEDLDPARDVLMTNGDPYDTGLTYMYLNNSDAVTYEFGYGLTYGDVEYRSISAPDSVSADEPFTVTVEVANLGQDKTTEVVELYIAANDSPYGDAGPKKQLVAFEKVSVPAASSTEVELTVDPKDFAVYSGADQDLTVLSGEYTLMAGRSSEDIQQTANVTVDGSALGVVDARERTDVFASAFAANDVYYREYSRQSTIDSLKADSVTDGYYTVVPKEAGSWVAVANVNLNELKSLSMEVAAKDAGGNIEVHLGSPDGQLLATVAVPVTQPNTYVLADSDAGDFTGTSITELSFQTVTAELGDVSGLGNETLYFVFQAPELRLASFSAETGDPIGGVASEETAEQPEEPTETPAETRSTGVAAVVVVLVVIACGAAVWFWQKKKPSAGSADTPDKKA